MSQLTTPSPTLPPTTGISIETTGKSPVVPTWGYFTAAILLIVHAPLLVKLGERLWAMEHYQFFPIIPLGAAWLAYSRFKEIDTLSQGKFIWRIFLWGMAIALYLFAVRLNSPWLAAFSFQLSLWALISSLGGKQLCAAILPAWFFLWLAVPLPLGIDIQLIQAMQQVATVWASGFLDICGYRHLVAGVTVIFPERSFLVEEACSGIHSLFAVIACSLFYLLQSKRGIIRSLFILLSAIFWVIVANAFRVFLVTVLSIQWDLPVTDGWQHEVIGMILFVVALLMIISTDRLFAFFIPMRSSDAETRKSKILKWLGWGHKFSKKTSEKTERQPKTWGRFESIVVMTLFVVLGIGQLTSFSKEKVSKNKTTSSAQANTQFNKQTFPKQWNGWVLTKFEERSRKSNDPNGQHSSIWYYQKENLQVAVSIDGPFVGWHNLNSCMEGQGWEQLSSVNLKYSNLEKNMSGGYTQLNIRKGVSQQAFVLFGVFDDKFVPLDPPDTYLTFRAIRRFPKIGELWRRLTGGKEKQGDGKQDTKTVQLQVFIESYVPLNEKEQQQAEALFAHMTHAITSNTKP